MLMTKLIKTRLTMFTIVQYVDAQLVNNKNYSLATHNSM